MTSSTKPPRIGFEKILYVTDLSESGRLAFPYAASLAHRYGAALTLYHVVETHDFEKYLVGYISDALWEEIRNRNLKEARQLLIDRKRDDVAIKSSIDEMFRDSMAGLEHPHVNYEVAADLGDPVERILARAHNEDYDLLIMAKHGHGAFKGALMGDTCQRVIRRCQKPVLVVEVPPKD